LKPPAPISPCPHIGTVQATDRVQFIGLAGQAVIAAGLVDLAGAWRGVGG